MSGRIVSPSNVFFACFTAYRERDYDKALTYVAPDVRVEVHTRGAQDPSCGIYEGHAGVRLWFARVDETWAIDEQEDLSAVVTDGDNVAASTTAYGIERATGVKVAIRTAMFLTVRDLQIVELVEFHNLDRISRAVQLMTSEE